MVTYTYTSVGSEIFCTYTQVCDHIEKVTCIDTSDHSETVCTCMQEVTTNSLQVNIYKWLQRDRQRFNGSVLALSIVIMGEEFKEPYSSLLN